MNNNQLTEFNVGNSHENNPLGGIPQGMGNNGVMNTVEEGETKKDSFIYSNRITLTPQVIAQFNLPKSLAGKTAADATKLINNKFEGRNSKIDNNTKKAFLDRIAEAQETVKAEEQAKIQEAMQINSTEVPDMMNGQVPQGMEEFMQPGQNQMFLGGLFGGEKGDSFMGASKGSMEGAGLTDYLNAGGTAATFGNQLFGKSGIDTSGAVDVDSSSIKPGMMGVQGAMTGVQAGSKIGGPLGGAIGGAIGLGAGLIGGNRAKKDALKAHQNFEIGQSNKMISDFALGGNLLGEPNSGDPVLPVKKTPAPVVVSKDNLQNLNVQPLTDNEKPSTSKLKGAIVELQNGSNKDGTPGQWVYYKKRSTPGFNPETDRDFVYDRNSKNLTDTYEYHTFMNERRKAVEKNRAKLNTNIQLTQPLSLNNTTAFRMGGNMYEGGGELKPWQQPSSKMTDDPNFNGGFGFKNMTGVPYATELPLDQQINVKYTPERGKFYKQSFNQMGRPQISNDLGYTSKLNYNDPDTVTLSPEQLEENNRYSNPELAPENKYVSPYPKAKLGETLNKAGQYIKDNYGNALRYAPVAMNAYQLAKMGKPEVETLDRLGNKYNPQYMDEKALTNQINAETNYTANALANASNGSLGSLSNNILGMQLNKTKALSDAYSKVADVNRNEDKTAQQFNLGVDQINIGQSNLEKDINAKNRGAFKTERSKLLGQIGNDLGNIGKETVYKKLAGKAFGYSYDGEYLLKPDGTKVSEEELDSTIKTNLSSVGATEKDGKYFDTTGKEISKEEVLKMIGTPKTFNKNYQGKFSSMNTNFGNISLTNNNKQ